MRRALALILTFSLLLCLLPVSAFSDDEETMPEELTAEELPEEWEYPDVILCQPEDMDDAGELPDREELLSAFLRRDPLAARLFSSDFAGSRLDGFERVIYDSIVSAAAEIAEGRREDAVVVAPLAGSGLEGRIWTPDELGLETVVVDGKITQDAINGLIDCLYDSGRAVRAALRDCPYELYWALNRWSVSHFAIGAKKVDGEYALYLPETRKHKDGTTVIGNAVLISLRPAPGYEGPGENQVDSSKTSAASEAANEARRIASSCEGLSNLDKLDIFQNEICRLNTYNTDAAGSVGLYGDPWQIIYVFDNDPNTNVVCEGYAKAFQFLCELSSFQGGLTVWSVTGNLTWSKGSGPHMWNIVRMEDGENYLADITNCDAGDHSDSRLFLIPPDSGSAAEGYTFGSFRYTYDSSALLVYPEADLTLADHPYGEVGTASTEKALRAALEGQDTVTLTGVVALSRDLEIPEGKTLILKGRLTPEDCTLHNLGTLDCTDEGTLNLAHGNFINQGTLNMGGRILNCRLRITADRNRMVPGAQLQLQAQCNLTDPVNHPVQWSLAPGDEEWAELSADGELTAKEVISRKTVTVTAANGLDEDSFRVEIVPYVDRLELWLNGEDVTGRTIQLDVNQLTEASFEARILPEGILPELNWRYEGTVGAITDNGDGTCLVSGLSLRGGQSVEVTLSASAENAFAAVKLHLIGAPQSIRVKDWESGETITLLGGKSRTFSAVPEADGPITEPKLTWALSDADTAYASITASGKLTTRAVSHGITVHVLCQSAANPAADIAIPVRLVPKTITAAIRSEIPAVGGIIHCAVGEPLALGVEVYPVDALTEGKWKSSAPKTCIVDSSGTALFSKPGMVTITYTAADGSGKKATLKLCAGEPVTDITVSGAFELVSGSKTTLSAAVNADAWRRTLRWSSSDPTAASVSSKGLVTAKTVSEERSVIITAEATDGSGTVGSLEITILPKPGVLPLRSQGRAVNSTVLPVDAGTEALQLDAEEGTVWKSSKPGIARVDENGLVTIVKSGTAVITTKSADGKRTGKVTLKISNLMQDLTLTASREPILVSGKGKLTLKAIPGNAPTSKAVRWSSSDPAVATVSSSGTVKAKAGIYAPTTVTITAEAKDNGGARASMEILVIPAAQSVSIRISEVLNNRTFRIGLTQRPEFILGSQVWPEEASQKMTWKSSNPKVAAIDAEGRVRLLKAGTVTLTAAAADGSGKKASFRLIITP